jgi:hypothetical protein
LMLLLVVSLFSFFQRKRDSNSGHPRGRAPLAISVKNLRVLYSFGR